jgi:hypothetical protein
LQNFIKADCTVPGPRRDRSERDVFSNVSLAPAICIVAIVTSSLRLASQLAYRRYCVGIITTFPRSFKIDQLLGPSGYLSAPSYAGLRAQEPFPFGLHGLVLAGRHQLVIGPTSSPTSKLASPGPASLPSSARRHIQRACSLLTDLRLSNAISLPFTRKGDVSRAASTASHNAYQSMPPFQLAWCRYTLGATT